MPKHLSKPKCLLAHVVASHIVVELVFMHVEDLADAARVRECCMRLEHLRRMVCRQIGARHDAVRHVASFSIGNALQPARFLHGIGRIVVRIDMHEFQHVDALHIAQQIVVPERPRIAHEQSLRIREPRVMMRLEVPQMNVRIDDLHGALLAR